MTEDFNNDTNNGSNNENNNYETRWSDGNRRTLKFLTVCLCAFLGGMVGMGLVGGMLAPKHHPYPPYPPHHPHHPFQSPAIHREKSDFFPMPDFEFDDLSMNAKSIKKEYNRELRKFNHDMEKMTKSITKNPNVVFEEADDAYIVKIDLSKLNNDEKNVELKIEPNYIKVTGKYDEKSDNKSNYTSFVNSFTLDDKIDVNGVKREHLGHKLILTLPKVD